MSKDVDRNLVLRNIRVRHAVKNDGSWIHKSKDERTVHEVESKPSPTRQKSYVLLTARRFDNSANEANGDDNPAQKDGQPERSTAETKDDTKPQEPTEPLIQDCETQPKQSFTGTNPENKEGDGEAAAAAAAAAVKSDVDHSERAADVSADVLDEHVQLVSSAKKDPDAVSHVEPAEQPLTDATADDKEEHADTPTEPSNVDHEVEVSTYTNVENSLPSTAESKGTVEVPAAAEVEPKPQEPACATRLEDAGADILTDESLEEFPPQQAKEEIVASAEPVLESRTEEVAECEAQSTDNAAVEQSVEPSAEVESGHTVELNIEDAVKPVLASNAEAVQDNFNYEAINLTDALDVEVPAAEAVPKPVEDAAQSLPEEPKLNQQCEENTPEVIQKPAAEQNITEILYKSGDDSGACCFCHQIIDGNVRITLSEPPVNCHQECLKCGVCAKVLGDLLTSIYLHDNVIRCDSCFLKTLNV
ncbi:uncharacterized protein PAE49_017543 [Odontesthes bonariensis]|uniref:uncharacterized protein LOC142402297 n=1 Tax=Odontesthes bonariensis TaxID=219752 RepID=UPI003F5871D2